MAFVDYSTAYPSIHRGSLSSTLLKNNIRGHMWYQLRARFDKIKLWILHTGISARHTVDILRGLPEGSRLSATLFGIFVADLVHELRAKFPRGYLPWTAPNTPSVHPLRTSGLEGYSMSMTWHSYQHVCVSFKLCYMSASNGVFEIVCKLIQTKHK